MNNLEALKNLTPRQLKRKLGRPPKYDQNTLSKAIDYLHTYQDNGEAIPTREGMALALGITRQTLDVWLDDKEKAELSYIVRAMDSKQAVEIISGGVRGEIPPKVVSLLLARHGYSEASQAASEGTQVIVNVDRTCGGVTIEGRKLDESPIDGESNLIESKT